MPRDLRPFVEAALEGRLEWCTVAGKRAARAPSRGKASIAVLSRDEEERLEQRVAQERELASRLRAVEPLDASEVDALALHGIRLFEGRLIVGARSAIREDERRRIEERLVAPIPEGLDALWSVAFGGRLFCDLEAQYEGEYSPIPTPFEQLYHLDAAADDDLKVRMKSLARGQQGDALPVLPFGGLRNEVIFFVELTGPDVGAVRVWHRRLRAIGVGLSDVASVAESVPAFFRSLSVRWIAREDPSSAHRRLARALAPLRKAGDEALAERVLDVHLASGL